MRVSVSEENLQKDIRLLHLSAAREEKSFREENYNIDIMLGLDFVEAWDEGKAKDVVHSAITYLSRSNRLNTHISYFAYYDYQPKRMGNGMGNAFHFHLFLDLDDKRWIGKIIRHIEDVWREQGGSDIRVYDKSQGGIVYSKRDHQEQTDGVGCPNKQSRCKKSICKYFSSIGESVVYSKDWFQRNKGG